MNYTPFYSSHIDNDGKIVDYGGWALPVNFGSQIKEHELVRSSAGMFDISNCVQAVGESGLISIIVCMILYYIC